MNNNINNNNNPSNPTTQTQTRAEAERLLGVSEKLLATRDLTGSREFALLALETDSLLEGSEQILAITDVLLASQKRVNNNRQPDFYSILQTDRRSEPDLLRKNYRRLALLLHPDKNNYPLANEAFNLVADAWACLSDPSRKTPYDHELSVFTKVDLRHQQAADAGDNTHKLPVRRSTRGGGGADTSAPAVNVTAPPPHASSRTINQEIHRSRAGGGVGVGVGDGVRDEGRASGGSSFWTACPYCYVLYEYPKMYIEYCVRCQNCDRAFQATGIPSMPPMVPGKEAYYCCWGFFPLGFEVEGSGNDKGKNVDTSNVNNVNGNNNNIANNVATTTTTTGTTTTINIDASGGAAPNNIGNNNPNMGFPNWMPGVFNTPVGAGAQAPQNQGVNVNVNVDDRTGTVDFSIGSGTTGFGNAMPGMSTPPGAKKRGRPKKNPGA